MANSKTRNRVREPGTDPIKGRVLVVEDHLDARAVVEEFLESKGYATSVTKRVEEAEALLRAGIEYDAVVLDLMLPGKDGYALLSMLRAGPRATRNIPVIVVSAFAPPRVKGATAVLNKPVDLARLLAIVESELRSESSSR